MRNLRSEALDQALRFSNNHLSRHIETIGGHKPGATTASADVVKVAEEFYKFLSATEQEKT